MVGNSGKPILANLFIEIAIKNKVDLKHCFYTANREDLVHDGQIYPSLWKLYIDFEDPSEYYFANNYFLSPTHWKEVSEHTQLKNLVDEWRKELELKIRADALRCIIQSSKESTPNGLAAAKYLLSTPWNAGVQRPFEEKRGRPNKPDLASHPITLARDEKAVQADYQRLTLNTKFLGQNL